MVYIVREIAAVVRAPAADGADDRSLWADLDGCWARPGELKLGSSASGERDPSSGGGRTAIWQRRGGSCGNLMPGHSHVDAGDNGRRRV